LLLLLGSLSFSVVFKQSCTFTLLAAGIRINFKLDATCNYTVAIEPLNNIVLWGFERHICDSQGTLLVYCHLSISWSSAN
jgi:hypothetical protein